MLLITVDKSTKTPVYRQICEKVIALIDEGALKPGDRLPTTRGFAKTLGIHRSTVLIAYDELRALGYLESAPGAYTTVRKRLHAQASQQNSKIQPTIGLINWEKAVNDEVLKARSHFGATDQFGDNIIPSTMIDLDTLSPDPALAPNNDLRRCIISTLFRDKATALQYTDPQGWRPLRELLAVRLQTHGVTISPDEIIITNGAQQAMDLIFRLLLKPGDPVIIEAPTYGMAHSLLRLHGAQIKEIHMTSKGMDLDALEKALATIHPKIIYTMPTFQNPMGITTNQAHRERLLNICERERIAIIEDGFEEEMKYFGKAVLPIKSMDTEGIVFYIGTFSKVIFSGLRIGWIAVPRKVIELLVSMQHASCLSVNTLAQVAFEQFCGRGQFEKYLIRVHKVYRRRMQMMLAGLKKYMPDGTTWTKPEGGFTLWLSPPKSVDDESTLCDKFWKAGLAVGSGRRYFGTKRNTPHFRLSIARVDEGNIEKACSSIGDILSERISSGNRGNMS